LYAALLLLAVAIAAIACAWSAIDDHSVRFNLLRTGRGFYRLPPLPIMYDPKTKKELTVQEMDNFEYESDDYDSNIDIIPTPKEAETAWDEAKMAIDNNQLDVARDRLKEYLELSDVPTFDEEDERRSRRSSAYDTLDAMSALREGSAGNAVKRYATTRLTNAEIPTESNLDRNLKDNWAYLKAARAYSSGDKHNAMAAFKELAATYPRSEKRESVLYMIAKLTMESSYSFGNAGCGVFGTKDQWGGDIDAGKIQPTEKCQDERWRAALKAFNQLAEKYPNGRYRNDVRGWIAYLYRRGGERAKSLAEYYKLLASNDRSVRLEAKKSIQAIGHEYDDKTLDKVEELIADNPNASLAYAYHRIYNVAIDHTYQTFNTWCCWGDDRWRMDEEEKKRVADETETGNHELQRVARFATALLKRYPKSPVSGDFLLRTAEAHLELQNFPEALKLSDRALNLRIRCEMRMEGLWVKGSSEHRLQLLAKARNTFAKLVSEFPTSKLAEGARRLIAMSAEDQGDLETALDLYIGLKYEQDVAYFIDVLLPTDRLARFIETRKDIPQYNQLLYALGVRYMRDGRWNEARETLQQVKTEKGIDGYLESDKSTSWFFPKETIFDFDEFSYIKTSWVVQDLKTIDILEYYEQEVDIAQGDEAKAEAMYQLASCYFEADDLIFYNPAAWKGGRTGALSQLQFSDHERLPDESRIIFEHLLVHDPWARSIPIYLEITKRFSQTKAAKDALYSAAVAHEKLSQRIAPWTAIYERGMFAGPRLVTYEDVKNAFPDYQLPRGTYGWKPSTRTVNGGAGWAPKPTPLPKVSRQQKVERKVKEWYDEYSSSARSKISATAATSYRWLCTYLWLVFGSLVLVVAWKIWQSRT